MSDLLPVVLSTVAALAAVILGIYVVHRVSRVRVHPRPVDPGAVPDLPSATSDV